VALVAGKDGRRDPTFPNPMNGDFKIRKVSYFAWEKFGVHTRRRGRLLLNGPTDPPRLTGLPGFGDNARAWWPTIIE